MTISETNTIPTFGTKRMEALKTLMEESSGINSYYDLASEIVVSEMIEVLKSLLDPNVDIYETYENKLATILSFERVLQYYTTKDEYMKACEEIIGSLK